MIPSLDFQFNDLNRSAENAKVQSTHSITVILSKKVKIGN